MFMLGFMAFLYHLIGSTTQLGKNREVWEHWGSSAMGISWDLIRPRFNRMGMQSCAGLGAAHGRSFARFGYPISHHFEILSVFNG